MIYQINFRFCIEYCFRFVSNLIFVLYVARIWKEMAIILCITTTADTSHNKAILEFRSVSLVNPSRLLDDSLSLSGSIISLPKQWSSQGNRTFIGQNSNDQSLYLLSLSSHYSLSLFYINARPFLSRSMITKQLETLLLSASRAVSKHDSRFFYSHSSTSSFFRRSWRLLVLCSAHGAWFGFAAALIVSASSIQAK